MLSTLYVVLFYYLATSFDKGYTDVIEKSTFDVVSGKRYSVYWVLFTFTFLFGANILYYAGDKEIDITWL